MPVYESGLDAKDKKIIRNLLVDARLSARQLSARLGMSTVAVLSRVRKLEASGVIKGYSARLDDEKLGYALTAVIELVAKNDKLLEIEEKISSIENVCAVYDVTGGTDTIIVAKFRDRAELSLLVKNLSTIGNVESTITHVVLNTVKEDFRLE
ncbi:transcriptional regulator [Cenarchaeum symbiosum A]|uniref:Transcriptional regulator n=1 Tax=Cenarchaeum symbiosum (strain A) TaxID=414004 RepID=A0RYK6_CENSY|nr:transcriptional regulator [Cenarchaeum symbiosum A]